MRARDSPLRAEARAPNYFDFFVDAEDDPLASPEGRTLSTRVLTPFAVMVANTSGEGFLQPGDPLARVVGGLGGLLRFHQGLVLFTASRLGSSLS
jgi:hypothetical protein